MPYLFLVQRRIDVGAAGHPGMPRSSNCVLPSGAWARSHGVEVKRMHTDNQADFLTPKVRELLQMYRGTDKKVLGIHLTTADDLPAATGETAPASTRLRPRSPGRHGMTAATASRLVAST